MRRRSMPAVAMIRRPGRIKNATRDIWPPRLAIAEPALAERIGYETHASHRSKLSVAASGVSVRTHPHRIRRDFCNGRRGGSMTTDPEDVLEPAALPEQDSDDDETLDDEIG